MKQKILALVVILVAVLVSGCSISFGNGSSGPDGGVYKTLNRGEAWQQKALIPTNTGKPNVINNLNATLLVMDPSDPKALYYGAVENGLFYSYDGAENWLPVRSLGPVTVQAFAVDPISKCTLYAAVANKVQKSTDCGRTWQQVYYDTQLDVDVNSIAVDHYDSRNVYLGTSRGEVIGSSDYGRSWRTLTRLEDDVKKIIIAPGDSRVIMAATEHEGPFRSINKGESWQPLKEKLESFDDAEGFRDIVFSAAEPGFVLWASNYGLLKSINYGDDWTAITLITPEQEATINAVAINQKNRQEFAYVTNTTFYSTLDGGENWITKKLPSIRSGWSLVLDPDNSALFYLALRRLEE